VRPANISYLNVVSGFPPFDVHSNFLKFLDLLCFCSGSGNRFARVIEISHNYEPSAGFPEGEYTACLDELYDYSMEVYARHDRSYDLAPLSLPELDALLPSPRLIGSPESTPSPRGDQEAVPASVWEPFRYPLNVNIYETLCAACFDHDSVGRHDELKPVIIAAIERTRAHLGVTNEQQHLCLARQHFEEYLVAERENERDPLRGRAAIENERKEMLTALQDHMIVSTLQDQNLPSFDGSGLVSPATSEAAEDETRRMREGVIKLVMEHFSAIVEDYHRCDVDLLPRALRVYVALRHPEDPQTVVREAMTLAVVRLYERLSEDVERPISPEGLCVVVTKVLSAIDVEIEKYADVWKEFITGSDTLPDSTGLFIRAIGSRTQRDPAHCIFVWYDC
jgi:enamine deaminase RidA (YjgF/YER057c/UK114 family)